MSYNDLIVYIAQTMKNSLMENIFFLCSYIWRDSKYVFPEI